jgi:uncharacterized protein YndB with AHSA1/START domain
MRVAIIEDRIEQELHIAASPEVVFSFFTDPAKHPLWMGRQAALDARPGGIYRCEVNDTHTVIGEFVLVEPPSRVVFTWGFAGNDAVPPGSSTVSITLTPTPDGTHLHLIHTGLPHPALGGHEEGWEGYLAQLVAAVEPYRLRS